jgi:hypothetical protein
LGGPTWSKSNGFIRGDVVAVARDVVGLETSIFMVDSLHVVSLYEEFDAVASIFVGPASSHFDP